MRAPPQSQVSNDNNNSINSNNRDDFSEYLWMEDMESFDKEVLAELEEEEELEQVMEEMLAEEEARDTIYFTGPNAQIPYYMYDDDDEDLEMSPEHQFLSEHLYSLSICEDILASSKLNPNAEEFIPKWFDNEVNDGCASDRSDSDASDR